MGAYVVDKAQQVKSDIPGKKPGLTFQVIRLELRDGDNQAPTVAEWFTPESTPVPAPGALLEGTLELGDYGWKFSKSKSSGNGNSGGTRGDLSPEAQARIDATGRAQGRAHAQQMALRYAAIKAQQGVLPADFKPDTLLPIIQFFYDDAQAAKEKP